MKSNVVSCYFSECLSQIHLVNRIITGLFLSASLFVNSEVSAGEGDMTDMHFRFNLQVSKNGSGTIISTPVGIDCGPECASMRVSYEAGQPVVLTATPDIGYGFVGWSEACQALATCQVTLDSDREMIATFVKLPEEFFKASCGGGSNTETDEVPARNQLCNMGVPSEPRKQEDGRYTWMCFGIESAQNSTVCHTLPIAGDKVNQEPIMIEPGALSVKVSADVLQAVKGGSGKGKTRFVLMSSTEGTSCDISMVAEDRALIKTSGSPGECRFVVKKGSDSRYYSTMSAPISIRVQP